MKTFWTVIGLVAGALALSAVVVIGPDLLRSGPADAAAQQLPWEVNALPDGRSQVFGLTLGQPGASTLGEAHQRWSEGMSIAIVAAPDEHGTLEAFVDPVKAGFITGKLVITAHVSDEAIAGMKARAVKTEYMESTTRRYTLAPDDLAQALQAPITALGFIPSANLDADTVVARFGPPAERLPGLGEAEHLLYPDRGLDIVLDPKGKELLQYVAPAAFERLRQPLLTLKRSASPAP